MTYLLLLLDVIAGAFLNHVRGGGGLYGSKFSALLQKIPGNGDITAAPGFFLLAWLAGVHTAPAFDWLLMPLGGAAGALLWSACWLVWATPAWGFLQGLGYAPGPIAVRKPTFYETAFIQWSGGNMHLAYFFRCFLFLIPMGLAFGLSWLLLAPAQVLVYDLAHRAADKFRGGRGAVAMGELAFGAVWGLALWFAFTLPF